MLISTRHRTCPPRRGTAAVELAIVLPLLAFLFVIAVDWARIYYYSVTITNCARQGALYGSDALAAAQSPYGSLQDAALADASNLSPPPTVSSTASTDGNGDPTIAVTVTWQFSTIANYPGITSPVTLSRTVTMRVAQ